MAGSKLKNLLYVTISLSLLVVPFAIDTTISGNAYALGGGGGGGGDNPAPLIADGFQTKRIQDEYTLLPKEYPPGAERSDGNGNRQAHKVPEPGTIVLLGAGLAGLVALRRNIKK